MLHKTLAEGRWFSLSLAEQLGNIGSEYDRLIKAKAQGNHDRQESALDRFLELMDLTLADERWAGIRRRELARLREQSLAELEDGRLASNLSKYYLQFAIAARAKH